MKFSETMFGFHTAESDFEDALVDAGFGQFERIGGDHYDNSIEFYGVENGARLTDAAQRIVFEAGFSKAYLNHEDLWETHYNWDQRNPFAAHRGWRRLRREGGFDISYWPEGWGDPTTGKCAEWLTSGYMRIIPEDGGPDADAR